MKRQIILLGILLLALIIGGLALEKYHQNPLSYKEATIPLVHDGYIVKASAVYWVALSPQRIETKLANVDSSTFVSLENGWGKDSTHIYYNGYLTRQADASVPAIHTNAFTSIPDTFYAKDDQAVYFPNFINNPDGTGTYTYSVFPDADPSSFVIVKPLTYAKDKSHVWSIQQSEGGPARKVLLGANPLTCTADNLKGCEAP
ncbi:hypothetical protein BH11PAT2_BH11PAT2_07600 [soil metagenome]